MGTSGKLEELNDFKRKELWRSWGHVGKSDEHQEMYVQVVRTLWNLVKLEEVSRTSGKMIKFWRRWGISVEVRDKSGMFGVFGEIEELQESS